MPITDPTDHLRPTPSPVELVWVDEESGQNLVVSIDAEDAFIEDLIAQGFRCLEPRQKAHLGGDSAAA